MRKEQDSELRAAALTPLGKRCGGQPSLCLFPRLPTSVCEARVRLQNNAVCERRRNDNPVIDPFRTREAFTRAESQHQCSRSSLGLSGSGPKQTTCLLPASVFSPGNGLPPSDAWRAGALEGNWGSLGPPGSRRRAGRGSLGPPQDPKSSLRGAGPGLPEGSGRAGGAGGGAGRGQDAAERTPERLGPAERRRLGEAPEAAPAPRGAARP